MSLFLLGILNSQAAGVAGGAYDFLESTVLTSSASSVTFTGLDSYSDYKHLQIRATGRSDASATIRQVFVTLNGDTGSNYSAHYLFGNGSSVGESSASNQSYMGLQHTTAANNVAGSFAGQIYDFLDFSNTNKNTTMRVFGGYDGDALNIISLASGAWYNTNAVTSITLASSSANFISGSRFSLIGIK